MANNVGDDLKNILMAGIGAVAQLTEKSKEWVSEMSKKGEEVASTNDKEFIGKLAQKGAEAVEQGKVITSDLKAKFQQTIDRVKSEAENIDFEQMSSSFSDMSDDVLQSLRDKLDRVIEGRKVEPEAEVDVEVEVEPDESDEV